MSTVASCWGCYHFLASIHLLDALLADAPLISVNDLLLVALGAIGALIAIVVAIVAIVKSTRKLIPALVLAAIVLLPIPLLTLATGAGMSQLELNTATDIRALEQGLLSPEGQWAQQLADLDHNQVNAALDTLEGFGVPISHADRQRINSELDQLKSVSGR